MAGCGKGAGQAVQTESEAQEGQAETQGQAGQAGQAGAECAVCGDVMGEGVGACDGLPFDAGMPFDALTPEEAVLGEVVESALDDLAEERSAVFDDEFIRSRRALNALKGRRALPTLLSEGVLGGSASGGSAGAGASAVSGIGVEAGDEGPEDGLTEEIIGSQTMWCGKFLSVEDVKVRLPNGRVSHRDVVRHPGAVAVIALTNEGKLVLVHQYRTSLEQVTLEIPAGKLNPGEDPARAAARELAEETGYKAARMAYLGPVAVAAGYSDEIIHMYLAMGLTFVGASPDDDEFLHVDLVDLGEMVDRVLDGKVVDSKTIIGVMLCDAISRRMEA